MNYTFITSPIIIFALNIFDTQIRPLVKDKGYFTLPGSTSDDDRSYINDHEESIYSSNSETVTRSIKTTESPSPLEPLIKPLKSTVSSMSQLSSLSSSSSSSSASSLSSIVSSSQSLPVVLLPRTGGDENVGSGSGNSYSSMMSSQAVESIARVFSTLSNENISKFDYQISPSPTPSLSSEVVDEDDDNDDVTHSTHQPSSSSGSSASLFQTTRPFTPATSGMTTSYFSSSLNDSISVSSISILPSFMGQFNETTVAYINGSSVTDSTMFSPEVTSSMFNFEKELTQSELALRIFGAIFCIILIASTIFGNTLVLIVVVKFHRMRSVTNILLASLAIADITVAIFVMPFLLMVDLIRIWPFGYIPCHLWISCDVMCCTASILHLCAIAIDR